MRALIDRLRGLEHRRDGDQHRRGGDQRGASGVEYALVISLLLVGSVTSIEAMDERIEDNYEATADDIGQPNLSAFAVSTTTVATTPSSSSSTSTTTTTTSTPPPASSNLAIGKPATISSVGWGGVASRGNDGDTNGVYGGGSVFHTGVPGGWWEVDLETTADISEVKLWNRTDCCSHRALDVRVYVDGVRVGTAVGSIGSPSTVTFNPPISGGVVRVENGIGDYFHLAEVEVIGVVP